jgi:hypothetical protein
VRPNSFLGLMAPIVIAFGALSSLGFLFIAGRHTPVFLLVLFVGWVLSPFIGLLTANKISQRWSASTLVYMYVLMLILTIAPLVIYSGALTPPKARPASIFLLVTLALWLVIGIFILFAKSNRPKE